MDDTEIDEPIGWADLELSMKRDDKFHGMQFEASTGTLEFYGDAAAYLQSAKELNGLRANVIFKAEVACDNDQWEEVYQGRLNFGKYKELCGTTCRVSLPAEEDSCRVIFKSRFDQKVDMDSTLAFDKMTGLPTYAGLGIDMEIPAKALQSAVAGSVNDGGDAVNTVIPPDDTDDYFVIVRPTYAIEEFNNINIGQLSPVSNQEVSKDEFAQPISPQLLFEDIISCFQGEFQYRFSFSGSFLVYKIDSPLAHPVLESAKLKVVTWDGTGTIFANAVLVEEIVLPYTGDITESGIFGTFTDQVLEGTIPLGEGIGIYGYIEFRIDPFNILTDTLPAEIGVNVTFSSQTSVSIEALKLCPPTTAQVYLIHEALSRVTEAITNRCLRVRSDYYGRTDSQPFAATEDGCGGLRLLTSGLKLRQAPNGQAKFFASAKDLIEGLWGVDNIGFGIEDDPNIPEHYALRIEPVEYFYQDTELLVLDGIPNAEKAIQETQHYSKIQIGYKKWEVEDINGLNEPNSNREYRTSLDTISNTLDATSALVTGSYPIEITRQQSFAESGAADTTYDNEVFMITLNRNAYDFTVEQGGIVNDANIFDPDTLLNFRLTPARNMLRWAKSVFNSYSNFGSSAARIFFNSGTGNISAAGELSDSTCKLEATTLSESQDISLSTFANQADATPLWRPEYMTFTYPLSIAQYNLLKGNSYGYISAQCGTGDYEKGFIQEIKYQVAKGIATFTLKMKW